MLISIAVFNQFAQHLVKANAREVKKFFDALAPRGDNRIINDERISNDNRISNDEFFARVKS